MEKKTVFETLSSINVNDKTEKKNGLTYLSWSWAWDTVKKLYPEANYIVHRYDNKLYLFDENLGYMVSTSVTIDNETIHMQLPVMDGANKAQKHVAYEYDTRYGKKKVEAATMFDINTAIMRCLVKNLAMFGLGLYIYSGEDLPEHKEESKELPILDETHEKYASVLQSVSDGKATIQYVKSKFTISKALEEKLNNLSKTK
jgi:hypothetical protein